MPSWKGQEHGRPDVWPTEIRLRSVTAAQRGIVNRIIAKLHREEVKSVAAVS